MLPFHKDDHFLKLALSSIYESEEVKINLILIDDRKNREQKIKCTTMSTGGIGYEKAINEAIPFINTTYVALMNSDDLVHPRRFIEQINSLKLMSKNLSVTGMRKFAGKNVFQYPVGGQYLKSEFTDILQLFSSQYANASWLSTSDFWVSCVKFPNLGNGSDWALGTKILNSKSVAVIPTPLYAYRIHRNQRTKSKKMMNDEISKYWQELNSKLGLPNLNPKIGTGLVFPNTFNENLGPENLTNLMAWVSKVEMLSNGDDELLDVLYRRISSLLWTSSDKFEMLRQNKYILSAVKMGSEALRNSVFRFLNYKDFLNSPAGELKNCTK
ncbi:MAG: glycosyltransferase family A protein [Bacteroidota bacterium]